MFFATIVTELFVIVPKRVGPSEPYIQAMSGSSKTIVQLKRQTAWV